MRFRSIGSIVILIFFLTAISLFSQEPPPPPQYGWQKEVVGNLSFTQANFDNWVQGGENSWAWQTDVNAKFIDDQPKINWANTGKISFGKVKISGADSRKSADEIKLESVLTYKLGVLINPYVAVTGLTQIATGYAYSATNKTNISAFMDPGYFTQSIGIGYSPYKEFKSRFGASLKETITSDYPSPYADDPKTIKIEKSKVELGAESVTDLSTKLAENILWTTKLELFSNLKKAEEIDVNFDNIFSAKVSKYMNVSLNVRVFYDRDISKKRQLKQVLALGLTYSLI